MIESTLKNRILVGMAEYVSQHTHERIEMGSKGTLSGIFSWDRDADLSYEIRPYNKNLDINRDNVDEKYEILFDFKSGDKTLKLLRGISASDNGGDVEFAVDSLMDFVYSNIRAMYKAEELDERDERKIERYEEKMKEAEKAEEERRKKAEKFENEKRREADRLAREADKAEKRADKMYGKAENMYDKAENENKKTIDQVDKLYEKAAGKTEHIEKEAGKMYEQAGKLDERRMDKTAELNRKGDEALAEAEKARLEAERARREAGELSAEAEAVVTGSSYRS